MCFGSFFLARNLPISRKLSPLLAKFLHDILLMPFNICKIYTNGTTLISYIGNLIFPDQPSYRFIIFIGSFKESVLGFIDFLYGFSVFYIIDFHSDFYYFLYSDYFGLHLLFFFLVSNVEDLSFSQIYAFNAINSLLTTALATFYKFSYAMFSFSINLKCLVISLFIFLFNPLVVHKCVV